MIENNLLQILVTFQKCGTLSKAAEELQISQPALSRSMQKLEEEMHVPLFKRGKNSLALNENGQLLASEANKLLKRNAEMVEKVRLFDRTNSHLHIGYSAPGPRLAYEKSIQALYPSSKISWTLLADETQLVHDLNDGKYDFIFIQKQDIVNFYTKLCLTEKLSICVHKNDAYASNTGVTFQQLDGQTFLQNAVVGIWDTIVKTNMPNANIVRQKSRNDLMTLINNSPLPTFVTNLTDFHNHTYQNRVVIPILDKCAQISMMFVCRKKESSRFKNVILLF